MFPEEGNLGLVLPTHLCKWTTEKVRQEGVKVLPKTVVVKVEDSENGKVKAHLSNGTEVGTLERVWLSLAMENRTADRQALTASRFLTRSSEFLNG